MNERKVCGYENCGVDLKEILITLDDGEKLLVLCLNHAAIYSIEDKITDNINCLPTEMNQSLSTCDACKEKSNVLYGTINYHGERLNIELCHEDVTRLIQLNLTPSGYINLREKHGIFHEIHDDFYDDEGYAFQPMVE